MKHHDSVLSLVLHQSGSSVRGYQSIGDVFSTHDLTSLGKTPHREIPHRLLINRGSSFVPSSSSKQDTITLLITSKTTTSVSYSKVFTPLLRRQLLNLLLAQSFPVSCVESLSGIISYRRAFLLYVRKFNAR